MKKTVIFLSILFVVMLLGVSGSLPPGLVNKIPGIGHFTFISALLYIGLCIGALFMKQKPNNEKPMKNFSYFSLIFTTGMGIGILFWGFAEVDYLGKAPDVKNALGLVLDHWTIIPWCMYAIFTVFELLDNKYKLLPVKVRLIKDFAFGISMMLGLATSFALGVISISDTIFSLYAFRIDAWIFVIVISAFVALSVYRGIDGGLKLFSLTNTVLTGVFFATLLFLLPKDFIGISSAGVKSFFVDFGYNNWYRGGDMQNSWTLVYWIWWLGWVPFVSKFIAIISKGRSIRSVVFYTVVVPSLVCGTYMLVSSSIGMNTAATMLKGADITFESIKVITFLPIVFVILMALNYITGADSQAITLDEYISSGVRTNAKWRRMMWVAMEMLLVAILLIAGSGTTSIISDLSFLVVPLVIVISYVYLFYIIKRRKEIFASEITSQRGITITKDAA